MTIKTTPNPANLRVENAVARLRAVVPRRALRPWEHRRIAELQANKLLQLSGLDGPAVPAHLISGLPRIQVEPVVDLPVSGATQWVGDRWLISIANGELPARQRFSLAHEFKHVLDHPLRDVIYPDSPAFPRTEQRERIADYFAACLLMPKRWVVRAWGTGTQRLSALSHLFDVSPRAMQIRLWQVGLVDQPPSTDRHFSSGGSSP